MKLLLAIATYKRIQKLQRCLDSISKSTYGNVNVVVVCDNNDLESAKFVKQYSMGGFNTIIQEKHGFVIGAWNKAVQEVFIQGGYDGLIGLCDDVELHPNALQIIVNQHKVHFPDTDGVLGFKQVCPGYPNYTFKWFGQTLIGRKFIERYKEVGYKVCCDQYLHFFQDEELYEYSSSLGKFFSCDGAILNHYHPGFIKSEIDETHNIIRQGPLCPKEHDIVMRAKRQAKGYLWGKNFNLIGEQNET